MTLPTFFIIGAAKSGTTSLASYLQQHPDVHVSDPKEPNFFCDPFRNGVPRGPAPERVLVERIYNLNVLDERAYRALFEGSEDCRARGEGSVRYLYFDGTAERIAERVPDARLIAVLREPVARMYSHYNMNRQHQLEPLGFVEALEAEPDRIEAGWGWDWHYAAVGRYAPQLRRYIEVFGREALCVVLYDDFVADPLGTFATICRHLGVRDDFVPDMSRRGMQPYRPQSKLLDRAINWPHPAKDALKSVLYRAGLKRAIQVSARKVSRLNMVRHAASLDPGQRAALAQGFALDNEALGDLLGRKLPWDPKPGATRGVRATAPGAHRSGVRGRRMSPSTAPGRGDTGSRPGRSLR